MLRYYEVTPYQVRLRLTTIIRKLSQIAWEHSAVNAGNVLIS
jgi:hypothetical protein